MWVSADGPCRSREPLPDPGWPECGGAGEVSARRRRGDLRSPWYTKYMMGQQAQVCRNIRRATVIIVVGTPIMVVNAQQCLKPSRFYSRGGTLPVEVKVPVAGLYSSAALAK